MRLLVLLLLPFYLFAIEAKVSLELNKNQKLFVSKKTTMTLKVMSTGFQLDNLKVDFGKNKDFLIVEPSSASYNDYEDGFSVVAYEYHIYPLHAGKFTLKPWKVSFSSSLGYGMEKEHFTKQTKSFKLNVKSPKGYDFILATPSLHAKTTFDVPKKELEVGDAITRKIVLQALDVPDVLIPQISLQEFDGVQMYREEPKLEQKQDGSKLISTRVQVDHFVFKEAGEYTIKALEFPWYDTTRNQVRIEPTKRFIISVKERPKPQVYKEENQISLLPFYIAGGFIIAIVILMFVGLYFFKHFQALHVKKELLPRTPEDELKAIILACKNKHLLGVYDGFYTYAKALKMSSPSLSSIKQIHPELSATLDFLEDALSSGKFDYTTCQKELEKLHHAKEKNSALLSSLNPS
jgi:hypothetical protein